MTTNSPNPVDGDVQALIEHCKLRIKVLQNYWHVNAEEMRLAKLDLRSYENTLASLTAEPVVEVTTWWPLGVDGGEQPFLQPLGNLPPKGSKLYTTPPAQVLRQVEKPKTKCIGWLRETIQEHDEKWIIAIRKAGYEVKND